MLLGVIAGYEFANRLGLAMGVTPSQRGWHKTAVVGPVGAAVGVAKLMKLSVEQMQCAVGLACATASGTKAFAAGEGGGMEKRMHAGRAAEAGVRMAQLAARGFTAPPGAIEGKFGLLDVMAGTAAKPELLTEGLGAPLGGRACLHQALSVLRVDTGGGAAVGRTARARAALRGCRQNDLRRCLSVCQDPERKPVAAGHDGRAIQHPVLRCAGVDG